MRLRTEDISRWLDGRLQVKADVRTDWLRADDDVDWHPICRLTGCVPGGIPVSVVGLYQDMRV